MKELGHVFSKIWDEENFPPNWRESIVTTRQQERPPNLPWQSWRNLVNSCHVKAFCVCCFPQINNTKEKANTWGVGEFSSWLRLDRSLLVNYWGMTHLPKINHCHFSDIRSTFDSVDRTTLWDCLLRNRVPEKYESIIKFFYRATSGRVMTYGKLSPLFSLAEFYKGVPLPRFSLTLQSTMSLRGRLRASQMILPNSSVGYAILLTANIQEAQLFLNCLIMEVIRYRMQFVTSKFKVLL